MEKGESRNIFMEAQETVKCFLTSKGLVLKLSLETAMKTVVWQVWCPPQVTSLLLLEEGLLPWQVPFMPFNCFSKASGNPWFKAVVGKEIL